MPFTLPRISLAFAPQPEAPKVPSYVLSARRSFWDITIAVAMLSSTRWKGTLRAPFSLGAGGGGGGGGGRESSEEEEEEEEELSEESLDEVLAARPRLAAGGGAFTATAAACAVAAGAFLAFGGGAAAAEESEEEEEEEESDESEAARGRFPPAPAAFATAVPFCDSFTSNARSMPREVAFAKSSPPFTPSDVRRLFAASSWSLSTNHA